MRRSEKPINLAQLQLHLPILTASEATVTEEKQKELAVALVELLISAAQEGDGERRTSGGEDERQVTRGVQDGVWARFRARA
jgi:hypothetical protein